MNKISKKEFTSNIYKYLKPGEYTLTYRGTECLQVSIRAIGSSKRVPSGLKVPKTAQNEPISGNTLKNKVNEIKGNMPLPYRVDTTTEKQAKIATAKSIPGVKTANQLAPEEVTREFPGIKTMDDYRAYQARQKEKENRIDSYSCGCKKVEDTMLCPKHGRG